MTNESVGDLYIAINMSKVVNNERSFQLMREVGPRICITTANEPGFAGFQANYQTGVMPMAGRYGGADLHMERDLNPIRNYQYTVWKGLESHSRFHREKFARVFELCAHCLSMVVEGPWEPIFSIVAARMPEIRGMGQMASLARDLRQGEEPGLFATPQRSIALAEHTVKSGREDAFEQGAVATLEAISRSPGFLGYMVLKQIGVNALGSFMLDPESMIQMLETLGANPPSDPKELFQVHEAMPSPPKYLIHSEWESPEMAQLGLAKVLVNHTIRKLHNESVMAHLIRGPYVMIFKPMMEDATWRSMLP